MTLLFIDNSTFVNNAVQYDEIANVIIRTQQDEPNGGSVLIIMKKEKNTQSIVFSLNRHLYNIEHFNNGHAKFLVFHHDAQLTWQLHSDMIAGKLSKYI